MRFIKIVCAVAALLWAMAVPSNAQTTPPKYPVEAYAKLPRVMTPKISPDGKSIAYITAITSGRKTLVAHPLKGKDKSRSFALPHLEGADISRFYWANSERILVVYSFFKENVYYSSVPIEQTRLFSVSLSGDVFNAVKPSFEQNRRLSDPTNPLASATTVSVAQIQSRIVSLLRDDADHILLALDDGLNGNAGVRRIDITTGRFEIIQTDKEDVHYWRADGANMPALGWGRTPVWTMGTYEEKPTLYIAQQYRDLWSQEAIYALLEQDANPVEILSDNMTAIFSMVNEHGRRGLAKVDLRTGDIIDWLFSHKAYDYFRYYRSDMTGEINGAEYIDDQHRQIFFGGREKQILRVINKVLPDTANRIINSDKDGTLFLIASDSPKEATKIFAFSPTAKTFELFAQRHSDISPDHVAPVTRHVAQMRDGLNIEVYVTNPVGAKAGPLPTVLMPHGGPSSRDWARFHWRAQLLANQGYRVLQPNFRGSSGYGDGFESLKIEAWGRTMQDDLEDTFKWAVAEGLTQEKRVCIVGGSYGGYAALMGAVKTPDLFQCAISINGVADLAQLWTDDGRFRGGKEWRLAIASKRSDTKDISPYHRSDEIKIPILLVHAKDDYRVNYRQSKDMYKRLKRNKTLVKYLELKTGGHSVDVDIERVKYSKALVAFLDKYIGEER